MYDIDDASYAEYRRKRVQRLKKIIPVTILIAILIPLTCSVIFILLYAHSRRQYDELNARYEELLATMESLRENISSVPEEQDVYSVSEVTESERDYDEYADEVYQENSPVDAADDESDVRRVYLTFDDGPSDTVTPEILNILKKNGIKATFFICNYDEKPGYAGVDNPLYTSSKCVLLLGDAKESLGKLLRILG